MEVRGLMEGLESFLVKVWLGLRFGGLDVAVGLDRTNHVAQ